MIYHTLLEILRKSEEWLLSKGVKEARLDTELIMAEVLGCKRLDLYLKFDDLLREPALSRVREMVKRRGRREPLAYILRHTDFYGLSLKCDSRALIPRQETEQLCEKITERLKDKPPASILDLGTGTGAILLALLTHWKEAVGIAVDQSAAALSLAKENAERATVIERGTFLEGNWFEPVEGTFDLIVSNPPYLTTEEWATAEAEVREMEPKAALVAEKEGLADLEKLLQCAPAFLKTGGLLAMETGIAHGAALETLAASSGLFSEYGSERDYTGRQRYFFARKL